MLLIFGVLLLVPVGAAADPVEVFVGRCVGLDTVQCLIDGDRYVGVCSDDGTLGDDRFDRTCIVDGTVLDGASIYTVCILHNYESGVSYYGDTWESDEATMCARDGSLCSHAVGTYRDHHGETRYQNLQHCVVKVGTAHGYACVLYDSQYWSDSGEGFHRTESVACVGEDDRPVCLLHTYERTWSREGSTQDGTGGLCVNATP